MKKSLVLISFAFIFLLSISIISATNDVNQNEKISFSKWLKELWGKITGKVAHEEPAGKSVGGSIPVTTCSDSDGNNINIQGSVTTPNNPPAVDVCMGSLAVVEKTCSSPSALQATSTVIPCPSGSSCQNGACTLSIGGGILPNPVTTCVDSDGNNITNKGNVTTIGNPLAVDGCMGSLAVIEKTCSSPSALQATSTVIPCPSGSSCQNGLCSSLPCTPNYVKTSCVNDVAVFNDTLCGAPGYIIPYDCNGNGVISGPSCSDLEMDASIDFLPFDNLINYSNTGNRTIQLAENFQGVEFDWDFSDEFNFCGVSLETSNETDKFGYVLFDYTSGGIEDKVAFVDRINKSNSVCIKDVSGVASVSEFSSKCSASGEIKINCPGNFTIGNPAYTYNCLITDDGFQYQIWPLKNSAVKEITGLVQQTACTENWDCTDWTNISGQCGTRTCNDLKNCGTILNKPLESKVCGLEGECVPDWTCTNFGKCIDGFKERTCTDSNNCGIEENKPSETSECKKSSLLIIALAIAGLILIIFLILYFMKRGKSEDESLETQNKPQTPPNPPRSPPSALQNRVVQYKYNQLAPQR